MPQPAKTLRGVTQASLRRLRNTPTYFFLIWRWVTWLYALLVIVTTHVPLNEALLPLAVTFVQASVVTLYAPVFRIFLPDLPLLKKGQAPESRKVRTSTRQIRLLGSRRQQPMAADDEAEILKPLSATNNPKWNAAIYALDVIICGLVTYYAGIFGNPPFGSGSAFYRYGLSTVLAAAFTYRYTGGLAAAFGYEAIILFGAFVPPPHHHYALMLTTQDFASSLIDAPLVALLAAYLATLLNGLTQSKRREQDTVRRQNALLRVSETLVAGAGDQLQFLQKSAEQIRKGGHFERLIVALITAEDDRKDAEIETGPLVESGVAGAIAPDKSKTLIEQVARTGRKLTTFEPLEGEQAQDNDAYRLARLYLPVSREGQVYMVLGAESLRHTPFDQKQENFLTIAGTQLLIALENIRLTEQAAELAAAAERGRIAREIHDGIAQLIYMMSLNAETCAALVQRVVEDSGEEAQALASITTYLDKLVTISKQALWETRHYMFTLKPLISGTSTLAQMLTNQLREFEAISGLPAHLEVEGDEERPDGDAGRARKIAQVGTAVFRITQEALTNAYKHANAAQITVHLRYLPGCVEVEIRDDGRSPVAIPHSYDLEAGGERQRIYGGHGIPGMRERAEELGGSLAIVQHATGGTSVRARIPM
ncbi:MAG TPA: ATP-binding protein [Ktedonobacteraceae bacterium]|nr:ATP-binding protein [Ktedonobacteraceae bacterium]